MTVPEQVGGIVDTGSFPPQMVGSILGLPNLAAIRNLTASELLVTGPGLVYAMGHTTEGDGGEGFFAISPGSNLEDDDGLIINSAVGIFLRQWDNYNCFAAWWGFFPSTSDNGPLFEKVPFWTKCQFQRGIYNFSTYPTQVQFSAKFYRGIATIWKCTGQIGNGADFDLTQVAFNWSWVAPADVANFPFGSDATQAGLSPIEGIGIISELGVNFGSCLRFGAPITVASNPNQGVRATTSHAAGQIQFEFTAGASTVIVLCTSAFDLTGNPGTQTTGLAIVPSGSIFWDGFAAVNGLDAWVAGDRVTIRWDETGQNIWTRNNTTNPTKWNNSNTANPDTNTGGVSTNFLAGSTQYFAGYVSGVTGDVATFDFGGSSFATPLTGSYVAYGASTTLNPADNFGVTLSNGNLTAAYTGGTVNPWPSTTTINYLIRPKNFAIFNFYCGIFVGSVDGTGASGPTHYFLTGGENLFLKGNSINYYYNQADAFDSTENLMFSDCYIGAAWVDGIQSLGSIKTSFRGCSFDYDVRYGYFSNNYTYFENCYFETSSLATSAELFALDTTAILDFLPGTSFLSTGPGYVPGDLFNFESSTGIIYLHGNPFCDAVNTTQRQFVQSTAGKNIYGYATTGFNGSFYPICVSPNNLLQNDYLFASGTTFYPASTCTFSGGFAVFTGAQVLNSQTMEVHPGDMTCVSFLDQLSGTISGLTGTIEYETADGTPVATYNLSTSSGIANFVGANSSQWTTAARASNTRQQFIFRVPPGASKANIVIETTGGSGTYKITSFVVYKAGTQ